MADNLNLEGIDTSILSSPPEPQKPLNLDLSGIDTSVLSSPAKKTSRTKSPTPSSEFSFQPEGSDFNLDKISSIQDFYQSTFGKTLPLDNQGQSAIHNKWGLDHRNAADIRINPNSAEGQKVMEYLRSNNIPYLAFTHAIPGVATGAHIHVGKPSKKTGETFQVGTTLSKDENLPNLDLSGIDTSTLTKATSTSIPELDLSNIDTTSLDSAIAGIEPSPVDPKDVAFKSTQVQFNPIARAAYGFTAANRPQLVAKNPDEMADPIIISKQSIKKPSLNDATDTWLNQWNPEYKKINDRFRAESGGINIVDLGNPGNIIADTEAGRNGGKNVWKIQARPTRESVALFEAVKEAYANGQTGVPAYLATGKLAQQQRQETQWNYTQQQVKLENYAIDHPYITAVKSAIEGSAEGNLRLLNNLYYLGKALYTGSIYGYDSQQYTDLINEEKQDAFAMQQGELGISRPEGVVPKVVAGAGRAALDLPKYILAGQAGLGSLTTLAYLENLHRGNREAALAALPMAVMEGGFHGFNEFLNSGTTKSINTLETNSDGSLKFDDNGDPIPIQKTYTENSGAGNVAPFRDVVGNFKRVTAKDLSLFQDSIVSKTPISIQQLSPLGRQLLLRGTNALLFGGTALITDPNSRNLQDAATHIIIGFGMPVGKSPKTPIFNELITPEIPKVQLQLDQSRVTVPLTPTTPYGESGLRQVGNTYLPSYETPTNKYLETTTPIEPNLEKGFQASATGQVVQLPLDTAALHLIDLERAMETGTWRSKGDDLATGLAKQKAITDAIDVLKQQIPPEVLDYFRKNEDVVRAALKSNYEANQTKAEFLERNKQSLTPDDIRVAPDKVPEIDPNATTPQETFKTAGVNNIDTSQSGAKEVLNTFYDAVNKKPSERGSFSNAPLKEGEGIVQVTKEEFDKIWNKTKDGLSYLNAFFIEDLYHRGVQPTIDLVSNRLNATLGDAARLLDDSQRKEIFAAGIKQLNESNKNTINNFNDISPSDMSPKQYESYLKNSPDILDNTNAYENYQGYLLYESNKLLSKVKEGVIKKVNDTNSLALWQDADAIVKVNGESYLLSKFEDPDSPEEFPKTFVWAFSSADKSNWIETSTSDSVELQKEIFSFAENNVSLNFDAIPNDNSDLINSSNEIGIRNKITTQQGFDQHRADLVNSIIDNGYVADSNGNDAFHSGLSADAFVDLMKLTKSDVTDFLDFSGQLIGQFGESIKPFLQDLWIQVKGFSNYLGEKFDLPLDSIKEKFTLGSKELKDSVAYKIRQFHNDQAGRIFLTKKEPEIKELEQSRKRIPYYEWYSLWRGVGIAQLNTQAGEVYDIMRGGQRIVNKFESNNLDDLQNANKIAQVANNKNVAETILIGNENFKRFTNAELKAGDTITNRPALTDEEIKAYNFIRSAQDRTLELRKQHILYGLKERSIDLNSKLQNATQGTPEYDRIAEQLLNISDRMTEVEHHYESLKASGYISTQRSGSIAVEGEDPNFPVGDPKRRLYSQFDTDAEANNWIAEQKANLGAVNIKAYDMKKPADLTAVTANLTPGQFEELIDSAGLNSKDPVVEQLREQVYSKFSSMGYNLKRDFVRGYDRDWKFVIDSVARQTENYGRSFYARVAGNEATKHLEATGLRDSDFSLYQTMQKYIDDEITSGGGKASQFFGGVRKGVYLFQLAYDINQLYLNALAQPVTQTYSYFSRVRNPNDTSEGLSGFEPEKYFKDGWSLAGKLGKEYLQQKIDPNYIDSSIPQEFRDVYSRLIKEHVVSAEFNRSLLNLESEKTVTSKVTTKNKLQRVWHINEHWGSAFMRAGEKTTRTHVAAEAYLVGKEKFNLSGEDLTNFIVRSIDATQSNPTKAEAPLIVRQPFGNKGLGEGTKLLYQFNAFNHMWIENLALNVKSDLERTFDAIEQEANSSDKLKALGQDLVINRGASTIRHLYPLVLMGGVRNLPLAGFSGLLYTLLTGDDVKKRFDKIFGKDTTIEQLAMYGFSTSENLGNRLTPSAPFVDNLRLGNSIQSTLSDTLAVTNVPAIATGAQIARGLADLMTKKQRLRGLGEVLPFKPMRNLAIAERYREQGVRSRANKTIIPKSKIDDLQLFGSTIGIQPTKLEENYDRQRSRKIIKLHKKIPLIRKIKI